VVRVLPRCAFGAKNVKTALIQPASGLVFDGADKLRDSGPVLVRVHLAPTRQGLQLETLPGSARARVVGPTSTRELVLESAIDPGPGDRLPGKEALDGGRAGPVAGSSDETLLATMAQYVEQAFDLGGLFFGNGNRLIATPPESFSPADGTADLASEIGVQEVHEGCEPLGVRGRQQQVVVVSEERKGVDIDRIVPHRAGEDAAAEIGDATSRLEQKPALNRPGSDLDEAVGR
jgi:hypothetical protein